MGSRINPEVSAVSEGNLNHILALQIYNQRIPQLGVDDLLDGEGVACVD